MQCNGQALTKELLAEKNQEQKEPIPLFKNKQRVHRGPRGELRVTHRLFRVTPLPQNE